jgi:hypothetical protein
MRKGEAEGRVEERERFSFASSVKAGGDTVVKHDD